MCTLSTFSFPVFIQVSNCFQLHPQSLSSLQFNAGLISIDYCSCVLNLLSYLQAMNELTSGNHGQIRKFLELVGVSLREYIGTLRNVLNSSNTFGYIAQLTASTSLHNVTQINVNILLDSLSWIFGSQI